MTSKHTLTLAATIGTGVLFYLADCLVAHHTHPDVPWLKSGFYNFGPFGILATACRVLASLWVATASNP